MNSLLKSQVFNLRSSAEFEKLALEIFDYQRQHNAVYQAFCKLMNKELTPIKNLCDIPFLPISFFKTHPVTCLPKEKPITTFKSSGTSSSETSSHFLYDAKLYEQSFTLCFDQFFPNSANSAIVAVLPSYVERQDSSLIYMVNRLIERNQHPKSGFYQANSEELKQLLADSSTKKILIGVTFALLDLAEKKWECNNTKVIETGGMKGRRKELIREELHEILQQGLKVKEIYSEYGMTELLSQAYWTNQFFKAPNWLKVFCRELTDPTHTKLTGKGALNIIDLANVDTCAFIATDDLGEVNEDGTFNVTGRIDHSQIRGCNLLV